MGELDGKSALITGGARGFGRAVALLLASEGADVAIADIASDAPTKPFGMSGREHLEQSAAEVEALGRRALAVRCDVRVAVDCARMAEQTLAAFGKIDILFANAGVPGSGGLAWELSEEEWDLVVDVDLKGVWQTTKYVVPHMIERRYGKIVMTSSRSGLKAEEWCAHYVAAKHGVIGYMKALAMELGPYEINVNAICPSGMGKLTEEDYSPFWDRIAGFERPTVEEFDRAYAKLNLFESVGRAEFKEVAEGVLWLVSDRSRLMTGSALALDAGYIVKRGG
jgi:NAD(P)-dependent dehydrogenase (short-subunit alcohol dehydrogenase family)